MPVAEGGMVDQALADRGPARGLHEVGLEARFVNENQPFQHVGNSGWRVPIQTRRRSATSGRSCSLASSVFLMAEAKPVQPFSHRAAMHAKAVNGGEFRDDLVQRQVALGCNPLP